MGITFIAYIKRYCALKEVKNLPKHFLNYIRSVLSKPFMRISNKLFFDKKKIVFDNFAGAGYGGNPKCIADELIKRGVDYKLVWIVKKNKSYTVPETIRNITKGGWRELFELATARIWVDDVRKIDTIYKSKNQYYIQTWHGGGPCLKKIEFDASDELPAAYMKCAENDSMMADLFISGCRWRDKNYRNAFRYTGEIMQCGTPTSDYLFKDICCIEENIRKEFNISKDTRIALYAPTFRSNHELYSYDLDYNLVINALETRFGGKWCIIVRLHPILSGLETKIQYSSTIINGTLHPQIEDILVTSEVLITDFSGCMFDGFRLKKFVFLYASDYKSYISKERKLYFDLNELPSPMATNNDEIVDIILSFDENSYYHSLNAFLDEIGYYESGKASILIADRIERIINGDF